MMLCHVMWPQELWPLPVSPPPIPWLVGQKITDFSAESVNLWGEDWLVSPSVES